MKLLLAKLLRFRRPALWRAFQIAAAMSAQRTMEPAEPGEPGSAAESGESGESGSSALASGVARVERALTFRLTRTERIRLLTVLGFLRQQVAVRDGDISMLHAAAEPLARAAELATPDLKEAGGAVMNHALGLWAIFTATDDRELLDRAVQEARRSRILLAWNRSVAGDVLGNLVELLLQSYDLDKDPELLREAVEVGREQVALNDDGWYPLAVALRLRYERTDDIDHLAEARSCAETSVSLDDAAVGWAELAHIHRLEHGISGALVVAREAAAAARRAVALTEEDDDDLGRHRALLAGALLDCHQSGDGTALPEAVTVIRSALSLPGAYDDLVICQTAAMVLSALAMRTNDLEVLAEAEQAAAAAVEAAAHDTDDLAIALDALSTIQEHRHVLTGDLDRLQQAIDTGWNALRQTPAKSVDRAGHLGNLASLIQRRYEVAGDREDLDLAVDLGRKAIALTPDGHPDLPIYLNNLNIALRHRYELLDGEADLNEAIEVGRRSVDLGHEGLPRAMRLTNLGSALTASYDRGGDLADLDEGVRCHREAVGTLPSGDPERPGMLNNLANALRKRYEVFDSAADLSEAAIASQEAVDTSARVSEIGWLRDGYGLTLAAIAEQTGDASYYRLAIEESRAALAATGADDPVLPFRLANLVVLLREVEDKAAAAEAVEVARRSLAKMPPGHYETPAIRSTLALALAARNADGDLDAAVKEAAAAVESAADGPDRPRLLVNLAVLLRQRSVEAGAVEAGAVEAGAVEAGADQDMVAAIAALREAARTATGPPDLRLRAAWEWGRLLMERGDAAGAAEGLEAAVRLMPVISPQRLERTDAHRLLADVAGLPEAAAALQLAVGRPDRALEMLEHGRGVLLHRVLRMRDDLDDLDAADAELAERFKSLRHQIDMLAAEDGTIPPALPIEKLAAPGAVHLGSVMAHRHERRLTLAESLRDVVERIRERQGLEHFLEPVPAPDLLAEAQSGPVVLLNVSEYGCDALLLTVEGLRTVALPDLHRAELEDTAFRFHRAVSLAQEGETDKERDDAEGQLGEILDWLWRVVVAPIFAELDHCGLPYRKLWWVPTAALAFLPLHAAMAADGSDSVLDRTVSSYTRP